MDQREWDQTDWGRRPKSVSEQTRDIRRAAKVSKNAASSMLAALPLVPTIAAVLLVIGVLKLSYLVIVFLAAVGAVIAVVLAREDVRSLRAREFDESPLPSPYIAAIAPWLYLWIRGNRLFLADPASLRPFWQHVALSVVLVLTLIMFPTAAGIGRILLEMQ